MTSTEQQDMREYRDYVRAKETESGEGDTQDFATFMFWMANTPAELDSALALRIVTGTPDGLLRDLDGDEGDTQDFATFMFWMANTPAELDSALALRIVTGTPDGLLRAILDGDEGLPALFAYYLGQLGEDGAAMSDEEFTAFTVAVGEVLAVVDRIDEVNRPGHDLAAEAVDQDEMTGTDRAELPDAFEALQLELSDVVAANAAALDRLSVEGRPFTEWLAGALLQGGCNNVFAANLHSRLDPLLQDSAPKTPGQLIKDRLAALGHPMG